MQNRHICRPEVYLKGHVVFATHTISDYDLLDWADRLMEMSKADIDWHRMGSQILVRALGDLPKVQDAIRYTIKQHDTAFNAELRKIGMEGCMDPPRPDWW